MRGTGNNMIESKEKTTSSPFNFTAVDFFCGAGGMTYGFTLSGINVKAGIDIDPECKVTYTANNRQSKFIEKDIHELSVQELAKIANIDETTRPLIFIACSPCQFWTNIKTTKEKSKATKGLLSEFERFVSFYKPEYVVIENVPGLMINKNESVYSKFLDFLRQEEYIWDEGIVNAHDYGVPQQRKRYLLIGTNLGKTIKLPSPEKNDQLTVREFIRRKKGFACLKAGQEAKDDPLHKAAELSPKNLERIRVTPKDGGTREAWKNIPELKLKAYEGKDDIFRDVYGRMFWDKPAPTLTTKFFSLSNGRFGHPSQNRAITLREGAVLQTFPRDYVFKGKNQASIGRQIGNAVPPELARRIAISIRLHYESVRP
jgi:DNA (cytosine-5)-methyltransferase 1